MEHGSKYHRRNGSLGAKGPARVFLGRKGPGRTGGKVVTIQGLQIVKVDAEKDLILIRGAVPGPKGGLVTIRSTAKTIIEKKGEAAGISANPQKASARVNPQKASARTK